MTASHPTARLAARRRGADDLEPERPFEEAAVKPR